MNINNNSIIDNDYTLTLTFEDDTEIECAVVAIFPAKNRNYIALIPLQEKPGFDPEEVFLYRYATFGSKDSIQLSAIETDLEYNEAADAFDALVAEHQNKK